MACTPPRYEEIKKLLCEDDGVGKLRKRGFDLEGVPSDGLNGRTFLLLACEKGDLPVVRALLDLGASPAATDDYGHTALMITCVNPEDERTELVECLLERADARASIDSSHNCSCWTALHIAACFGNVAVVRVLLCCGADAMKLDKKGNTAEAVAWAPRREEISQSIEKFTQMAEWRPWNHIELPTLYRDAMRTMLILAKA